MDGLLVLAFLVSFFFEAGAGLGDANGLFPWVSFFWRNLRNINLVRLVRIWLGCGDVILTLITRRFCFLGALWAAASV